MEIFGVISAIIGLAAAVMNRRRIVVVRHETADSSSVGNRTTIGKRIKRLLLALALFIFCAFLFGSAGTPDSALHEFIAGIAAICMLVGAYQFVAIVIMVLWFIWR